MLYVTGDLHGEYARLTEQLLPCCKTWTAADSVLVCGDFGYLFTGSKTEEAVLNALERKPFEILFVDGNHENFPRIYSNPVENWKGGKVHRIRKNIRHLMRGQVFTIAGQRIFTFGGGYSADKAWRKEGKTWWPEEMPTVEEYEEAERNLQACDWQVDVVLTHTAPWETLEMLRCRGIVYKKLEEERPLNDWLEYISRRLTYQLWYFGHFHGDGMLWRRQRMIYYDVCELENGRVVNEP